MTGGLIGGVVTWKVTKKSLEKQLDFEMKTQIINDLKGVLKALTAIKRETKYNVERFETLEKKEEDENLRKFINLFEFSNDNWLNFSHQLYDVELKEKTDKLKYFYTMLLSETIKNDFNVTKKTIKIIIEVGYDCLEILDKNIEFMKDKINKLENNLS